jgi:hypothetical protein
MRELENRYYVPKWRSAALTLLKEPVEQSGKQVPMQWTGQSNELAPAYIFPGTMGIDSVSCVLYTMHVLREISSGR